MQRQFSSGSRQAPDPFDQFLEDNNYYRKHTARDSSCLFRVISEQMYDTQLHHATIRKRCVRYMRKHRECYENLVDRDFDEYLDDMSKLKTYGTLIELQATGCMFGRNVMLFEPFTLGNLYCQRPYFTDVFRVFYTPERHFDSVYTSEYIKIAAICQSICYELLYTDLYKLPDVSYAVEYMLHSQTFDTNEIRSEMNEHGYCTRIYLADGREFILDLPNNTNCILENHRLCHFHYTDFPSFADDLHRELSEYKPNREDYDKNVALCKTADSLLPHKYVSCVRQLLEEGITPFPYKVAKALDPNMYRNIEFDAWNEARKELKLHNWYNGDANFKVGAKCHVQLRKSGNDLYTCHIQEIALDKGYCIVFVEQLGEKRMVPYDALSPLPPDQFKPWALPYRMQRHTQKYSSVRFTRQYNYNYRLKLDEQYSTQHHEYCGNVKSKYCALLSDEDDLKVSNGGCYYDWKQFTQLENFRHTVEYCTMPLTVTTDLPDGKEGASNNQNSRSSSRSPPLPASASAAHGDQTGGDEMAHCPMDAGAQNSMAMEHYEPSETMMPGPMASYGDYGGYYPMQPYMAVAPDEYYGGGYDSGMHAPVYPHNSGGVTYYYMYNQNQMPAAPPYMAPSSNVYLPTGPPMHGGPVIAGTPAPNMNPYYPPQYYGAANPMPAPPNSIVVRPYGGMASTNNGSPMPRGRGYSYLSRGGGPLQPRIPSCAGHRNCSEHRKSYKGNGSDLPEDVSTLRQIYNLGVECLHMHYNGQPPSFSNHNSYSGDGIAAGSVDTNENVNSLAGDLQQVVKLDDSSSRAPTPDSNNNVSVVPSNTQNMGKTQGYAGRRYNTRSYNNTHYHKNNVVRERTNYSTHTSSSSNFAGSGSHYPPSRPHTDYNRNAPGGVHANKNNAPHNNTPNSSRPSANQQQSGVHPPTQPSGGNSVAPVAGGTGVNVSCDPEVRNSPLLSPYVHSDNGGQLTPTPNAAFPHQNIVALSPYDCAGAVGGFDVNIGMPPPNAAGAGPHQQSVAANGGVYLAGPYGPPGPYGMYAPTQCPMPPPMGMHAGGNLPPYPQYMNPTGTTQYPIAGIPPTPPPFNSVNYYNAHNGYVVDPHDHGMRNDGPMPFPPCMAYPPPQIPYYVSSPQTNSSSSNNNNSGNASTAAAAPPPPPPANTNNNQTNTNTTQATTIGNHEG